MLARTSPLPALAAGLIMCTTYTAVLAEPVSYIVDPKHTYASFEINHLGLSTARGTFDRTSGDIVLDAAAGSGYIEIVIDTASIDTGLAKRDEHLRAEEFFNVDRFPTMKFVATSLQFDGGRPISADGELTMLGKTLPVSLRITHFACGQHPIHDRPVCGADAETRIRRSLWGMTTYVPTIGDEVTIRIGVEAFRLP
ncbi:MAG: polyisoprenoid-binding protein [Betaproteobacteria bacterium]|nr:MAG: polyisoprenoid-binding protein [Betaproteobacteria bacterium]